MTLEIY